jgi:hypothetical protein
MPTPPLYIAISAFTQLPLSSGDEFPFGLMRAFGVEYAVNLMTDPVRPAPVWQVPVSLQ